LNLGVDLVAMRAYVCPRVCQILGSQTGIRAQEFGLACAGSTGLFEGPHWNSSSSDTGIATGYAIGQVDARICVTEVACDVLQQLGLLATRHFGHESLCLFDGTHVGTLR